MKNLLFACTISPILVLGQLNIYRYAGCSGDPAPDEVQALPLPEEGKCTRGRLFLPGWEVDTTSGDLQVFYDGNELGNGCYVSIDDGTAPDDSACGETKVTFTRGACRSLSLSQNYGIRYCCQREGCSFVYPASIEPSTGTTSNATVRDVTLVKRSAPLAPKLAARQDECRFEPNGDPFQSRGNQQPLGDIQSCAGAPNMDSCDLTFTQGWTIGSSQTFGASVEASAGFFDLLSVSVSFSYEYTYEESQTVEMSHTEKVAPGISGYATFTQLTECVTGTWRGNCDWDVDVEGDACIPTQGTPGGIFGFVQQA